MIGILGSQCSVLGTRFATGLNDTVIQDNEEPGVFDGRLITSASDFLVTNTGDFLEYSEFR
jgi:hypothetical protein